MLGALALAATCFAGTSCVTASDLERRDAAFERYQDDAEDRLEALRQGTITDEEYRDDQRRSAVDLKEELAGVLQDVKDRTESVVSTIGAGASVTGLGPIGDLIATALLGGVGAYTATNKARDIRRMARGERVGTAPPQG